LINAISKIFTAFFLPPGIFILIFLFLAYKSKFKKTALSAAIILYLLSIKPVSNLALTPLENIPQTQQKAKYVVLLGGGFVDKDIFKLSPHAFKREVYAFKLAKDTNSTLIFAGYKKEITAFKHDLEVFKKTFNLNIKTLIPSSSINTYQNATTTKELFEKLNLEKKIYLVTSAFHMKRSIILYKAMGFEVIPKPTDFLIEKSYHFWDFLPSAHSFYKSYIAIHEYFGILSLLRLKIH